MTDLLATLKAAGFKGQALKQAWAIAKRESGGRATAYNPNRGTGDDSYGLFQINMLGALGPARRRQYGLKSNEDLYDPATNARVAYAMSKGGTDFGAWGVGPNAYRKTAPLDLSGFPGGGGGAGSRTAKGVRGSFKLPTFSIDLEEAKMDLDLDQPPMAVDFSPPPPFVRKRGVSQLPYRPGGTHDIQQLPFPRGNGHDVVPLNLPKGVVDTSVWKPQGTHITSGLDLNKGTKSAIDIMAKPGTAVAAPADGTVVRLGSAQGGQSMYFRDDRGYMWWLGHIDGRYSLPAGTRVRAGQTLSRISADHAAPHLHLDRTLSPVG